MNVEAFLDSNIPLYAASKDPKDAEKREKAAQLMLETRFGISLQVAQEFYHNARIKARLAISVEKVERIIELLLSRPCVVTDAALFAEARRLCERYQLRYWDAAIVAAARRQGAPVLYSEDLTHGQEFEGVRVVNPFLEKP
ncbi:MAG: PIN domain-containing protein [Terrimicrobiaceae bacterium]